jgi:hypothetical protein
MPPQSSGIHFSARLSEPGAMGAGRKKSYPGGQKCATIRAPLTPCPSPSGGEGGGVRGEFIPFFLESKFSFETAANLPTIRGLARPLL